MSNMMNGYQNWLAEISAITYGLAINGIRMPFFSQTKSISHVV